MRFEFSIDLSVFESCEEVGKVMIDLGKALQRFGKQPLGEPVSPGRYFQNQLRHHNTGVIVARSHVVEGEFDPTNDLADAPPEARIVTSTMGLGGADMRPFKEKPNV